MDVVEGLGLSRTIVMHVLLDFENAGDIFQVNGEYQPLIGDEVYAADKRGAKFRVGDVLLHKLTRERLLVLKVDTAHADEPLYEVRTNGYRAVVLREQELLPYNDEDERAPLPGEPRVPIQAERVEIVTPNAVTLIQGGPE